MTSAPSSVDAPSSAASGTRRGIPCFVTVTVAARPDEAGGPPPQVLGATRQPLRAQVRLGRAAMVTEDATLLRRIGAAAGSVPLEGLLCQVEPPGEVHFSERR
jgi:hypothetical protein